MNTSHLAITMPAYNEAEGLPQFLAEIAAWVTPRVGRLTLIVADDRSTDNTLDVLAKLEASGTLGPAELQVHPQPSNRGHGPTALAAYRAALSVNPDVIIHIDGDGQFLGQDIPRIIDALRDDVDVVHGVRVHRTDPWFRKLITGIVRAAVTARPGRAMSDVNTPLRAYRPGTIRELVTALESASNGADVLIPHVHFSLAESRWGLKRSEVRVKNIPRRGDSSSGTMWGANRSPVLPSKRLRRFVRAALRELWELSLRRDAPMRTRQGTASGSEQRGDE